MNVLVSAGRKDSPHHAVCRRWLEDSLEQGPTVGLSELVLSGVLRVMTHPRAFTPPTSLDESLAFVDALLQQPGVVRLRAGDAHWQIFRGLCLASHATGNRIPDAYHAALAIEHGAEWISLDHGFSAYPGLRFRNLLARS